MCEQKAKGGAHLAVRKRWPSSNIFNKAQVLNIEVIIIIIIIIKVKLKVTLEQAMKAHRVRRCIALLFNLGARWGGWSRPRPGRFAPGKDPVPVVQEAGWAPGTVWTGAENLAPTGIRSPDRPARSESLYRLS